MRSAASCLGALVGGWLVPALAVAAPAQKPTAVLSWVRAPGAEACANLAEVAARVNARLGRPAFVAPTEAKLLIEATITGDRESGGFRVRIVLNTDAGAPLGTRDLGVPGDDCRAATDTAALAIALMIDPDAAAADSEATFPVEARANREPPQPAPPAKPSGPIEQAASPASRPTVQSDHWRTRLGVAALASVGQLPSVAIGALGLVRLSPASGLAGVDVSARYLAKKDQELRPNVGGTFSASSVGLAGFWAPIQKPRITFSVAAGGEVGVMASNGYNLATRNDYRLTWLTNAALDAELAVRLTGSVALLLRSSLKLPLVREHFEAKAGGQTTEIFSTSAMIGDLALGVAFDP